MADAINPRDPNLIHVGVKQGLDGTAKLVVSSGRGNKEVNCKVLSTGLGGRIHATFLQMRGWMPVQHADLRDRHIQVYVQSSDLDTLVEEGFDIRNEALQEGHIVQEIPESISNKVKAFFADEKKAEEFLEIIQMYMGSGRKKLNLDGAFNNEGQCPDIFQDPIFKELQDLSLVGISNLPNSLRHLKKLTKLDLSYSSLVTFPPIISQLSKLRSLNLDYSGINQLKRLEERGRGFGGGDPAEMGARLAVNELFGQLKDLSNLEEVGMTSLDVSCFSSDVLDKKFKEIDKKVIVRSQADVDLQPFEPEDHEFLEIEDMGVPERTSSIPVEIEAKIRRFFALEGSKGNKKADQFVEQVEGCMRSGGKELVLDGLFNNQGQCPEIFNNPVFSKLKTLSLQGIKYVPSSIKQLHNLVSLDLSYSPIVDCFSGIESLKSLKYLNLAFSGINQVGAVIQFGRDYSGGGKSDDFYLQTGHEVAIQTWINQLKGLEGLKAVNMAAENRADSKSASMLAQGLKRVKVFFADDPNWKK